MNHGNDSKKRKKLKQLKAAYRKSGAESCIHASRGKVSGKKTNASIIAQTVGLRSKKPHNISNYTHVRELFAEELGIITGLYFAEHECFLGLY